MLVDGGRVPPEQDIKPGESTCVRLDFDLPPEDGRYQVVLSPMREGECWYYERGWPFLLVEGEAAGGVLRLGRVRVATAATQECCGRGRRLAAQP